MGDGKRRISCIQYFELCTEQLNESCPDGYNIISTEEKRTPVPSASFIIECKD